MELRGSYQIPAPRSEVWRALFDVELLQSCIPGCKSLTRTADGYDASVILTVGPIRATFKGKLTIEDQNPPERCTLKGEGNGGLAGFARGSAAIELEENDGVTTLDYVAETEMGGKIAQVGLRLIQSTMQRLMDQFFRSFSDRMKEKFGTT